MNNILANKYGLSINHISWEDTGRTKGSCYGPNISDMTLCVNGVSAPMIRKPNFSDMTSDQDMSAFTVSVGNESGANLKTIPLKEYLEDIKKYTDIKLKGSLLAERDTHVLTSAQACILPLKDGKVEFGVQLYNYQSQTNPAVLVIIASAEGTSAHYVMERKNQLDFNKNGRLSKFVAERLKDYRQKREVSVDGPMTEDEKIRNALMIYQIPLKVTNRRVFAYGSYDDERSSLNESCCQATGMFTGKQFKNSCVVPRSRGMDHAIVSTTAGTTSFPKLAKYTVERDTNMPIRCTIQYYHVSDESEISEDDMKQIASEVVRHNPISSLVVDKTLRPTEHTVPIPPHLRLFANL